MLVIHRKKNTEVQIGDAKVRILELSKSFVRLGIEAPDNIEITRDDARIKMRVSANLDDGELNNEY